MNREMLEEYMRRRPSRRNSFEFRVGEDQEREQPLRRDLYSAARGGGHSPEVSNIVADHGVMRERREDFDVGTNPFTGGPVTESRVVARGPMLSPAAPRPDTMRDPGPVGLGRRAYGDEAEMNQGRVSSALDAMDATRRLRAEAGQGMSREAAARARDGFFEEGRQERLLDQRDAQMGMSRDIAMADIAGQTERTGMEQAGALERVQAEQGALTGRAQLKDEGLSLRHAAEQGRLREQFEQQQGKVGFHQDQAGNAAFVAPSGSATGFPAPQQEAVQPPQRVEDPQTGELLGYTINGRFEPLSRIQSRSGAGGRANELEAAIQSERERQAASGGDSERRRWWQRGPLAPRGQEQEAEAAGHREGSRTMTVQGEQIELPPINKLVMKAPLVTTAEQWAQIPPGGYYRHTDGSLRQKPLED